MVPVEHNDPINARILAISEDKIEGFVREPFQEIAQRSGVDVDVVMARIAAMLRAGTIRRGWTNLDARDRMAGRGGGWRMLRKENAGPFGFLFLQRPSLPAHVARVRRHAQP